MFQVVAQRQSQNLLRFTTQLTTGIPKMQILLQNIQVEEISSLLIEIPLKFAEFDLHTFSNVEKNII